MQTPCEGEAGRLATLTPRPIVQHPQNDGQKKI